MSNSDDSTYSAVRTVLGVTRRDACWHLTDEVDVLTVLGRAVFDLRSVETTGGEVVEISVNCVFGFIDFIVPDGTIVVLDGTSFLAGARSDVTGNGEHEGPRIEITALTVLGRTRVFSPGSQATELAATAEPEAVEEIAVPVVETTASDLDTPSDESQVGADDEAPATEEPVAEDAGDEAAAA